MGILENVVLTACDMLSAERQVFSNWSVGQKNPCKGLKSTETPHLSVFEITSSIPNNTFNLAVHKWETFCVVSKT